MRFPLGFSDLTLLLAVTALILLVTSELLSLGYGRINILLSRKKLRNAAIFFSVLFFAAVAARIVDVIIG